MTSFLDRILQPVKRQGAETSVRLMLTAFAASVILTRLFLSLTGYPQVGGGTLHIAHLLWGGLLLFAAALLPLIFSNRWVYRAGAVLAGIGVGLFIDEVGKFITRTNDYFYPAAAPLIYAFFLLTVLLYLQIRRAPATDDRTELYRAFDDMSEVLDHDLDPHELAALDARLRAIAQHSKHPDYSRLAVVLLDFLHSETAFLTQPRPGRLAGVKERVRALEARWSDREHFRILIAAGLVLVSIMALGSAAASSLATFAPSTLPPAVAASPAVGAEAGPAGEQAAGTAEDGPASGPVRPAARTFRARVAFWLRSGLEVVVGLLLLVATGFLLFGNQQRGVLLGLYALLLALTTVNLLVFYFDQFGATAEALLQFGLLQALLYYRRRYLAPAVPRQRLA